jgi:hypothetical protein
MAPSLGSFISLMAPFRALFLFSGPSGSFNIRVGGACRCRIGPCGRPSDTAGDAGFVIHNIWIILLVKFLVILALFFIAGH